MAPKANVISVMAVQHAGKNEKGQIFAQHVHSQGDWYSSPQNSKISAKKDRQVFHVQVVIQEMVQNGSPAKGIC
jgi:hypothetical protein